MALFLLCEWFNLKTMKPLNLALFILFVATIASCTKKSDNTTTTPPPTSGPYFPKVRTIIQNNCLSCHNSTGTWAGRPTAFDNDSEIVALSASIKAAVADPVTITNKRMPQGGSLSSTDMAVIVSWYGLGGKLTD